MIRTLIHNVNENALVFGPSDDLILVELVNNYSFKLRNGLLICLEDETKEGIMALLSVFCLIRPSRGAAEDQNMARE